VRTKRWRERILNIYHCEKSIDVWRSYEQRGRLSTKEDGLALARKLGSECSHEQLAAPVQLLSWPHWPTTERFISHDTRRLRLELNGRAIYHFCFSGRFGSLTVKGALAPITLCEGLKRGLLMH
jgi:hypothetical protein